MKHSLPIVPTSPEPPRPGALGPWLEQVGASRAFDALARATPDAAVFAVDARRNVVYFSKGAERLLGFSAEEVLGAHCLKSNRCVECMRGCGIAEYGTVSAIPLTLYRADGAPVRVRKTATAFFDEQARFLGGVEVLVPDEEPAQLPSKLADAVEFHGLLSREPEMHVVFDTVRRIAATKVTVLVRGESGTGKELVARAIHAESPQRDGPFVAVNCASLAPSLMESELFGHVRGAFTGAIRDHAGIFERASGGTLLLDEVGELSLEVQAKLLRVLEEQVVLRVGANRPVKIDVRVVAATHRSLREAVRAGRFREDLMFRLRVVPIFLPPLRQRRSDIDLLLWHFIAAHAAVGGRVIDRIVPDAMRALLDHSWPGNVRELRNVVEYALAVGQGAALSLSDLPPELRREEKVFAGIERHPDERTEALQIRDALRRSGDNLGKAAAMLGMSRTTLWRRRRALRLE